MPNESWDTRLRDWFHSDYHQDSCVEVQITETEPAGEASVRCSVRGRAIAFNMHRKPFSCLKNQKCADGFVLQLTPEEEWELHVIECKQSVTPDAWKTAKAQFEGAILNAFGIIGILGITRPSRIKCYVAFRHDKLSPDSVLLKAPLGQPPSPPPTLDWRHRRLTLLSDIEVDNIQIQLDKNTGVGNIAL